MRVHIRFVFAAFSALLAASPAAAQLHLAWDDCGAAGTTLKTSACDQNLALNNPAVPRLYGSFIAPAGISHFNGMQAYVEIAAATPTLPDWWMLGTGNCRPASLHVAYNTPCATANDYWGSIPGGAFGGAGYFPNYNGFGANTALIKLIAAVDGTQATALQDGAEYYAFTLIVDQQQTVGAGSCSGCPTGVAIAFVGMSLVQTGGVGDLYLVPSGAPPTVSWQCRAAVTSTETVSTGGGGPAIYVWSQFGFDCSTPATPRTWGQVKSLYR